jgi:hypothetical protein
MAYRKLFAEDREGERMNQKLMNRINNEFEILLSDGVHHAIDGFSYVLSGDSTNHDNGGKILDLKIKEMQKLSDDYELGLINDADAKKELSRILHGSQNTGSRKVDK